MARHDPQMNVRIPENLLNEVKKEAGDQRRTMTAQINLIIEEWLDSKNNRMRKHESNRQQKAPESWRMRSLIEVITVRYELC